VPEGLNRILGIEHPSPRMDFLLAAGMLDARHPNNVHPAHRLK
jgi:hypothetical protein